jgi:hypothetical protein
VKHADGSVTITYLTNGDVGGWIPKPVVNFIMTKGKNNAIVSFNTVLSNVLFNLCFYE